MALLTADKATHINSMCPTSSVHQIGNILNNVSINSIQDNPINSDYTPADGAWRMQYVSGNLEFQVYTSSTETWTTKQTIEAS